PAVGCCGIARAIDGIELLAVTLAARASVPGGCTATSHGAHRPAGFSRAARMASAMAPVVAVAAGVGAAFFFRTRCPATARAGTRRVIAPPSAPRTEPQR